MLLKEYILSEGYNKTVIDWHSSKIWIFGPVGHMEGQNVASACDLRQNVHFQVQIFILPSYPVNNSIVIARVLFSPRTYIILFLKLGIITNNVQYTKPKITSEI